MNLVTIIVIVTFFTLYLIIPCSGLYRHPCISVHLSSHLSVSALKTGETYIGVHNVGPLRPHTMWPSHNVGFLRRISHVLVTQGDLGGRKTLQHRWTTFLKADLLCPGPEHGRASSVLQDMAILRPEHGSGTLIFYGIFSSQW